jgi:hypothetical protein
VDMTVIKNILINIDRLSIEDLNISGGEHDSH